jgi:tRNA(Ile)-lysidine synthase
LRVGYETLAFAVDETAVPPQKPQLPAARVYTLPIPGVLPLAGGWRLSARADPDVTPQQVRENRDPWRAYVDVGERHSLQVRPRRPGERFRPLGMGGRHASLQDVMVNRRIDARLRSRWPLVAVSDHLVWVVGHHLDRRARVTSDADRIVLLECRRDLNGREKVSASS